MKNKCLDCRKRHFFYLGTLGDLSILDIRGKEVFGIYVPIPILSQQPC